MEFSSQVTSTVLYLERTDLWEEEKPYYIHGHRPDNVPRDNYKISEHEVLFVNSRGHEDEFKIESSGFEWARLHQPSEEKLDTPLSIERYMKEISEFIKQYFDAEDVLPYEYQVSLYSSFASVNK